MMYYLYFTYREFGLGTISQITAHMTKTAADNAIADLMRDKPQAHYKLIEGIIVQSNTGE